MWALLLFLPLACCQDCPALGNLQPVANFKEEEVTALKFCLFYISQLISPDTHLFNIDA